MKKSTLTLLSLGSMAFVFAGCLPTTSPQDVAHNQSGSENQVVEENITTQDEIENNETPNSLVMTGRSLNNTGYSVELLSGVDVLDMYASADEVYKITHLSSGKTTSLIVSAGSRDTIINQRNSYIMPNTPPLSGSLQDEAFNSYTIAGLDWYQITAPVDRILLAHESSTQAFVLDFDDPSGMQNKMMLDDITTMLEYFSTN